MSRRTVVRPGPALDRLLDIRRVRFLQPYLGQTSTISMAAAELDVSVARMSYQTARLLEAGLVECVNLIERAGRPIAQYRSSADEFIVALRDLGGGDLESFLLASEEPLRRALIRGVALSYGETDVPARDVGLRLRRTATADIEIAPCTLDGRDVTTRDGALNGWHVLTLTPAEARDLKREFADIIDRYGSSQKKGSTHLVRVAIARVI